MSRKIGLFSGGSVGLEIARFLGEQREPLAFLVIDSNDCSDYPRKIFEAAGIAREMVIQSSSLGGKDTLNLISKADADLFILAWWPYIIKEELIRIPKDGTLNFHPSLLPYNRGKNYNFWNLVEDVPFGVTLHFIDQGIDSGDVAFQSIIEKSWEDTGETLYYKAQSAIVQLFKDNFQIIIRGNIPRQSQDADKGSFHLAKELDPASEIVLDKTYRARDLLNLLRARTFPPHPAAWFEDEGRRYEVRIEIRKTDDIVKE